MKKKIKIKKRTKKAKTKIIKKNNLISDEWNIFKINKKKRKKKTIGKIIKDYELSVNCNQPKLSLISFTYTT